MGKQNKNSRSIRIPADSQSTDSHPARPNAIKTFDRVARETPENNKSGERERKNWQTKNKKKLKNKTGRDLPRDGPRRSTLQTPFRPPFWPLQPENVCVQSKANQILIHSWTS
jgi:hypothetical protein